MEIIFFALIIVLMVIFAVVINIKVKNDIKKGIITKEDIELAEEEHRIW
jgi:hypothetical protein